MTTVFQIEYPSGHVDVYADRLEARRDVAEGAVTEYGREVEATAAIASRTAAQPGKARSFVGGVVQWSDDAVVRLRQAVEEEDAFVRRCSGRKEKEASR